MNGYISISIKTIVWMASCGKISDARKNAGNALAATKNAVKYPIVCGLINDQRRWQSASGSGIGGQISSSAKANNKLLLH